ncbi:MAG: NADH:flavin oxidoreductase [Gemmataceae bacterium]|nr:NADH:flavin oxidoreductase [Gemmataceae bacterium]
MSAYRRVSSLKTREEFCSYLQSVNAEIPLDDALITGPGAPLGQPFEVHGRQVGNRFAILPMEGWDASPEGRPNDLVRRRWQRFGQSGAKLIWGGEAVAVRPDGRANPNQLVIQEKFLADFASLREELVKYHAASFGRTDDLLIGLQLTHSGRFARPNDKKRLEPRILYRHPALERRYPVEGDSAIFTDDEIETLIEDFLRAAQLASRAGFDFVDIKHCHGYLGHEFLSAHSRNGKFGGSFENRTRFLRQIVAGIRATVPKMQIGVRLSAFDWIPFLPGPDGRGVAMEWKDGIYPFAFGGDGSGTGSSLEEPVAFLHLLSDLGIRLVCVSCGSPYYNPHIQRPALFPPSDGYQPPEDPLAGVARQIAFTAALKKQAPELIYVGAGYSYLQEWLPLVAQAAVQQGMVDSIGLGRMVLSYPELPADTLAGKPLERKRICRTFSDCTTGPRNGLISGCFPLDPFYKGREEARLLQIIKQGKEEK